VRKLRVFLQGRGYYSVDYHQQEIKGYRLEGGDDERRIVPDNLLVEKEEPLKRELEAFISRCQGKASPFVSGQLGRQALETAFAVVDAIP
jgi:hypothetical protein